MRTLNEHDEGISNIIHTSLYKFHQKIKVKSIFEFIKLNNIRLKKELERSYPLGEYPWSRWVQHLTQKDWDISRHVGPTKLDIIKNELLKFINLYNSIRENGYIPNKFGHPVGILLIDDRKKINNSYFIVLGGNHRIAVLCHLGFTYTRVRLFSRYYIDKQIIKYSDIKKIELRHQEQAEQLFDHFVKGTEFL